MVTAVNDITGASIQTKPTNELYGAGHDLIFNREKAEPPKVHKLQFFGDPDESLTYMVTYTNGDSVEVGKADFERLWFKQTGRIFNHNI